MNKFLKVVAIAAAGVALACLASAPTWAACPGSVTVSNCGFGGGTLRPGGNAALVGGSYWIGGQGNNLTGPGGLEPGFGADAGLSAGFPLPIDGSSWVTDLGAGADFPGLVCVNWDWQNPGQDGCGDPGTAAPMVAVLRDDSGNFALMQVAGVANVGYDFDTISNGLPGATGGESNGVSMVKAVSVSSSSDLGGTVDVTVAALNLVSYDDLGGNRALPGTVRLRGRVGAVDTTLSSGPGGATVNVDADSDLCWELVDGSYTVLLGCRSIGGNTPSQNVINGKAGFEKGGAAFTWDVTAQFDVLGFNIYQKNVTKGTDRKVNDGLIGLSGDNDATAESYKYVASRSDLRAWKGGFDIELVRQNGETSRAPVTLTK